MAQKGAQVSDRISRMLENLSVLDPKKRNNPNKGKKHKATLEREASKSEKEQKAKDENSDQAKNEKLKKILILVRRIMKKTHKKYQKILLTSIMMIVKLKKEIVLL